MVHKGQWDWCEDNGGELRLVLGVKACSRRRVLDLSARSRSLEVSNGIKPGYDEWAVVLGRAAAQKPDSWGGSRTPHMSKEVMWGKGQKKLVSKVVKLGYDEWVVVLGRAAVQKPGSWGSSRTPHLSKEVMWGKGQKKVVSKGSKLFSAVANTWTGPKEWRSEVLLPGRFGCDWPPCELAEWRELWQRDKCLGSVGWGQVKLDLTGALGTSCLC